MRYKFDYKDTYDRKNGSPRLQRNREPWLGGSVATILSASQVLALLSRYWPIKSRGSIGNICGKDKSLVHTCPLSMVLEYLSPDFKRKSVTLDARKKNARIWVRGLVGRRDNVLDISHYILRASDSRVSLEIGINERCATRDWWYELYRWDPMFWKCQHRPVRVYLRVEDADHRSRHHQYQFPIG